MALTNFGALTSNQLTAWSRKFWHEGRNKSFVMSFAGTSPDSMIQRITELRNTTDGARAVITLVNDAQGDGVVDDNTLEGNEEAMNQSDQVIQLSQLRHAHRSAGQMTEQAQVVRFRNEANSVLGYWVSDRMDQLAFLTLSGISYAFNCDGSPRVGSQFPLLKFASDVHAPTSKRFYRYQASDKSLQPGDTTQIAAADTPSWAMLVLLKAAAENAYMRPIRTEDGIELFHVFMSPDGIARLKQDSDFLQAWRLAEKRSKDNPIFKGTPLGGKQGIYIDGLNILNYRRVFTTKGAADGSKWGSGGHINGQRVLLCGAQALGFADIGMAKWKEKEFDYDNQPGIAVGKIMGFLKPKFYSIYSKSTEDFSCICCDTAI